MTLEDERAAYIRRELQRYRLVVEAGRNDAAQDAVQFCTRWQVPPPRWLVEALRRPVPRRKRGQPPDDRSDYHVWDLVTECRDRRGEPHVPRTFEAAYEAVAAELGISPDTVRATYLRVLKRMRANPGRYYLCEK